MLKKQKFKGTKKLELDADEGHDLPAPAQTGTCRFCEKALFGNRYYHFSCLYEHEEGSIDEDFLYDAV